MGELGEGPGKPEDVKHLEVQDRSAATTFQPRKRSDPKYFGRLRNVSAGLLLCKSDIDINRRKKRKGDYACLGFSWCMFRIRVAALEDPVGKPNLLSDVT